MTFHASRRSKLASSAAVIMLVTLVLVKAFGTGGLSDFLLDARFAMTGRAATSQIVLVDIDEKSLSSIGVWPWPRSIHADIIDRLAEAQAAEILFDIDFSSRSNEIADAALANALGRAPGNVTLAANRQRLSAGDKDFMLFLPQQQFAEKAWIGLADVNAAADGKIRSIPFAAENGDDQVPAFSAILAGLATPRGSGSFRIDFGIDARQIEHVSVIDLLDRTVPFAKIAGRKIIVGASSVVLKDYFAVPRYGIIQGSLIHALGAETLLQGRALESPGLMAELSIAAILLLFAAVSMLWLPSLAGAALAIFLSLVIEAGAAGLQSATPLALDTAGFHLMLAALTCVGIGREIMERGTMWRAARREKQSLLAILDRVFDDSAAAMLVIDNDGVVRAASRAALPILAIDSAAAIVGQPAQGRLPPQVFELLTETSHTSGTIRLRVAGEGERILDYTRSRSVVPAEGRKAGASQEAICLTLNDVTEQVHSRETMEQLARLDALTQLPNRNSFIAHLSAAAIGSDTTLILIDIDHFKVVNEAMGQKWGNAALQHLASQIEALAGPGSFVARIDGDEFAVLAAADQADGISAAIASLLEKPLEVRGRQAMVGVSLGVAPMEPGLDADRAVRRAGLALTEAKAAGGRCIRRYSSGAEHKIAERAVLERELSEALKRGEFCVYYQPQVSAATGEIVGAEALVRWPHPMRGLVPPSDFIPLLEQTGLIGPVGRFVLQRACEEAATWPKHVRIAVNVAVPQLISGNFAETVADVLATTGLAPGRLDLELTESLFIQNPNVVSKVLGDLRKLGAGLALDDFGTGYSSLAYIKRFPVTKVKLDRAFIRDLPDSAESVAIVQAVSAIAGALTLKVVAEGVETPEQLRAVQLLGCHEVQGFLTGRPMPAADFAALAEKAAEVRAAA